MFSSLFLPISGKERNCDSNSPMMQPEDGVKGRYTDMGHVAVAGIPIITTGEAL